MYFFKKFLFLLILFQIVFYASAKLPVDDFEDTGTANLFGTNWFSFDDGYSTINTDHNFNPGYNGSKGSLYADVQINIQGADRYSYSGITCLFNDEYLPMDLSDYNGVRFYVKGHGCFNFRVTTPETLTDYNHFGSLKEINTNDWQLIELPFSYLLQSTESDITFDSSQVMGLQILFIDGDSGEMSINIDNIEFYTESEAKTSYTPYVSNKPKINQAGYQPERIKQFTVITDTAEPGDIFTINKIDGTPVYSGVIPDNVFDDTASSGESVYLVDFTEFKRSGKYYIELNGIQSFPFTISNGIYKDIFIDALRCFYIIRANDALDDPVTGISHQASHQGDVLTIDTGEVKDFNGGWYNAGDYGRWTHEAAYTAANMMWIYELKKDDMTKLSTQIPESNNSIPDILDEVKWGLQWLMKMQNTDGSVYHKVDSQPDFAWGLPPEEDPHQLYARYGSGDTLTPSTIDIADFTAVMAQASRVFSDIDPVFAEECLNAAVLSWNFLLDYPDTPQNDPYYLDDDTLQERIWAAGEMYRLTGSQEILEYFGTLIADADLAYPMYLNPDMFGYMAAYFGENTDMALKETIFAKVQGSCDYYMEIINSSGYGVSTNYYEYWWGSNSNIAGRGNLLILGYLLTGNQDYLNGAFMQLDYILGRNSLEQTFVSGYGTKKNENPYHWAKRVYNIVMPGWLTGGANSYPSGADEPLRELIAKGTPPAKCYADLSTFYGSWASNEGATDQTANLIFLTGMLNDTFKEYDVDINYFMNSWNNGMSVNLTITNNSSEPIDNWKLEFDFPENQVINSSWCCSYEQNGNHVYLTNQDWNKTIQPGCTILIGFYASHDGINNAPGEFVINNTIIK